MKPSRAKAAAGTDAADSDQEKERPHARPLGLARAGGTFIDTSKQAPRAPFIHRAVVFALVVIPFLGVICAILGIWGWGVTWIDLTTLLIMYTLTALGVTIGYHRLFTHRSFETIRPIKVVLGALGSMAVQGPLIKWVAMHRRHHQFSDGAGDPHSPHEHGPGLRGILLGFWHAHIGWMFDADPPDLYRYVPDLSADRLVRTTSNLFGLWVVLGLLLPGAAGGLLAGSWTGVILGVIWGGLVRLFLVHHMTWSVNSVCHLWGTRPYAGRDESRNNALFGILAFGEGWHNNHHAFPASARHGLRWWQVDVSYYIIRLLVFLRMASCVRLPPARALPCSVQAAQP